METKRLDKEREALQRELENMEHSARIADAQHRMVFEAKAKTLRDRLAELDRQGRIGPGDTGPDMIRPKFASPSSGRLAV